MKFLPSVPIRMLVAIPVIMWLALIATAQTVSAAIQARNFPIVDFLSIDID